MPISKVKVHISGGLGNQLFQISFAHYLSRIIEEDVILVKPKLNSQLSHTQLFFFSPDNSCKHCKFKIHRGIKTVNKLRDPWRKKKTNMNGITLDLRTTPFLSPSEVKDFHKKRIILGYFQHKEFVKAVEDVFIPEIIQELRLRCSKVSKIIPTSNLEIIHIRQGDTLTPTNRNRVGVLNQDYYRRVLEKRPQLDSRIVITDDILGASRILKGCSIDRMFGPEELDPWNALYLMSNAKRLITANSTFSWWGGLLANKMGAEVIIPRPFFFSRGLSADDALSYTGFTQAPSSFLE